MRFTPTMLGKVLATVDLSGFTVPLRGDVSRYVVGLTNNTERSLELLSSQAEFLAQLFDSITIGGRSDPQSDEVYIDVGTTTDDLNYAMKLCKKYRQQCIRDNQIMDTIYPE